MTPSEIAALSALAEAATPGPWLDERGKLLIAGLTSADVEFIAAARTAVPALLSALEEARRDAKANMDGWRKANADYMRLKESEDTDTITNAEILGQRDDYFARAKAAEARADALQAERDALAREREVDGECITKLEAELGDLAAKLTAAELDVVDYTEIRKERDEARARADAAWRAGVEAAIGAVESTEDYDFSRAVTMSPADHLACAVSRIRALPPPSATAAPAKEEKVEARPEVVEVTDQGGEPMAYFTKERVNAVAFEALLRDGPFLLDIPPDLTEQIAYEWWRETPCDCGDHGCHYQMAVPEDPDAFAVTVWHVEGRGWLGRAPSRGEVG